MSSVQAHSLEWDEVPGKLSKMSIDESKIAPENRIPRVTSATWFVLLFYLSGNPKRDLLFSYRKYENGAVGSLTHCVTLQGTNYSCELEVFADGYSLK